MAGERLVKRLEGHAVHPRSIVNLAWSPDGNSLATAGDDGTVQFWDAESGENLKQIQVKAAA